MLGFRKNVRRFNAGLFSGIGANMRNEGEIDLVPNFPKENKYFLLGLPINARFNYLIGRKFAAGISGCTNINSSIDMLSFMLSIGYRI